MLHSSDARVDSRHDAGFGSHGDGLAGGDLGGTQFGQTEIQNFGAAVRCEQDVIGLEVAVDDIGIGGGGKDRRPLRPA
jgi:hypothetical protein